MADTTVNSSREWLQPYEQSLHGQSGMLNSLSGFSDATIVPTSYSNSMDSPSNSTTTTSTPSSGLVSPNSKINGGGSFSKSLRRRSRASKKTPTTHLNANISNFRALVQKFTGCPKRSSTGPFNLNFNLGRIQNRRSSSNLIPRPFGDDSHQYHQQHSHEMIGWPEQARCTEGNYCRPSSLDDHDKVTNSGDAYNSLVSGGDPITIPSNSYMSDAGFFLDDFDLHEFATLEESFSSEIVNDCDAQLVSF